MTEIIRKVTDFEMRVSYTCPVTNKKINQTIKSSDIEHESEDCHICGTHIKIYLDMECGECKYWHEMIIRNDDPEEGSLKRSMIMKETSYENNQS